MVAERDDFLEAVTDDDSAPMLAFIKRHETKGDCFDLGELLETMDRKQVIDLWNNLFLKCSSALEGIQDKESEVVAEAMLQGVVTVAMATLSHKHPTVPQALFETTVLLNGIMMDLDVRFSVLQNHIAKLCERWWNSNLDGRENLAANILMYLLIKALATKATMADVKRVWQLHGCLTLVDLSAASSTTLKTYLLNTIALPLFIRCEEGRKFATFLFTLSVDWIDELHRAIKKRIPNFTKTVAEWYGEIYFKAWKTGDEQIKEKIENACIQDFMFVAVHARRSCPKPLSPTLGKILGYIHKQKKQDGVEAMLYKLYEPILWRSLKVANRAVRVNAAELLVDAFPLQNPELGVTENEEQLQKQFDILHQLLHDPDAEVRCVMVQGICAIFNKYWEMVPSQTLKDFIQKMVREHAWDGSSANVRQAVIYGFINMLDNHLSHPLMKSVLPDLQNMFHDTAEKVRVAFCELLDKAKKIRTIRFWKIVPVEHILARMEDDTPFIVRRLVALLFDSYMPLEGTGEDQLMRCIHLVELNPGAARVFYQYATKHMSLSHRVKFMTIICKCILQVIVNARKSENESRDKQNDENSTNTDQNAGEESEGELTMDSIDTFRGLLETVICMWEVSKPDLLETANQEMKDKLRNRFGKALPEFFKAFHDENIVSSLMIIAALLPPSLVPVCSRSALSKLKAMTPEENTEEDYRMLLMCICEWEKAADVLELISDWLEAGLTVQGRETPSDKNPKRVKTVAFVEPIEPQPMLALDFLVCLIQHYMSKDILLRTYRSELLDINKTLKSVINVIEKRFKSTDPISEQCSDDFLVKAFLMHFKLTVVLHKPAADHDSVPLIGELLAWMEAGVVATLQVTKKQPGRKKARKLMGAADATLLMDSTQASETMLSETLLSQTLSTTVNLSETLLGSKRSAHDTQGSALKNMAYQLIEGVLDMAPKIVLIGMCSPTLVSQLTDFMATVTSLDDIPRFLPLISELMYQVADMAIVYNWPDKENHGVANMIIKIIETMDKFVKDKKEQAERVLPSVKPSLSALFTKYYDNVNLEFVNRDLMSNIIVALTAEVSQSIRKDALVESCDTTEDMPTLAAFFLTLILKNKNMIKLSTKEFCDMIDLQVQDTTGVVAVLVIVNLLSKKSVQRTELEPCIDIIEKHLQAVNFGDVTEEDPIRDIVSGGKELLKTTKDLLGMTN